MHRPLLALWLLTASLAAEEETLKRGAHLRHLQRQLEESQREVARIESDRVEKARREQSVPQVLAVMVLIGMATGLLAASRGKNPFPWFFGGTLLPILGLVIVYFAVGRTCRCQKLISWKALVCPHCRTEYPPPAAPLPRISLL
ncbi:MAG: hypothetical protein K2X35_05400 [Bryobacteraceae bacterium]|nr:hypothetical protein [Bryobacteraceae bacterium]